MPSSEKRKVLHVITLSEFGGAQDHVLALARNTDRSLFDVEVACAPGGVLVDKLQGICPVHTLQAMRRNISPWNDLRTIGDLVRLMKAGRYDVVHTHSSKAGILGRVAARIAGIPQIIHSIHGFSFESTTSKAMKAFYVALESLIGRFTSMTIIGTHMLRIEAIDYGLAEPERIATVHYGIETGDEVEAKPESEAPVVGVIARLAEQKGVSYFLKAIPRLSAEFPDARFEIVGDGPQAESLKELAMSLGISDKVQFHGYRDDWQSYLERYSIFVLPSLWEGLPLVLLTAMARRKAIVATKVGGIEEAIISEENGLLVPPGSEEALVEAISRLLKDPALADRLGAEARRVALERFDEVVMSRRIQQLYSPTP